MGKTGSSFVPVHVGLGIGISIRRGRRGALGLLTMANSTLREAEGDFMRTGGMSPSGSTPDACRRPEGTLGKSIGPEAFDAKRSDETVPQEAVTAMVSLYGLFALPSPGEDGRDKFGWPQAACSTVSFYDANGKRSGTLYFGKMPKSGMYALEAMHIGRMRPDIVTIVVADGAVGNRQLDLPPNLAAARGGDWFLPCVRASEDVAEQAVALDCCNLAR